MFFFIIKKLLPFKCMSVVVLKTPSQKFGSWRVYPVTFIYRATFIYSNKRTRSSETRKRCSFVREFCFGSFSNSSWSIPSHIFIVNGKRDWQKAMSWTPVLTELHRSVCILYCNSRQSLRTSWKLKFCPYWSRFILIQVQSLNYCHLALGRPEVELPKNWIIWQPVAS